MACCAIVIIKLLMILLFIFKILMRDDALPLAHIAIAVEGAAAGSPDIVPLMVASSIIGSYDLTFGGGKVSYFNGLTNALVFKMQSYFKMF